MQDEEVDVSAATKILAYLGQLRPGKWVLSTKICADLGLRYTTTKNALAKLEDQKLVAKQIESRKNVVAAYCIPNGTVIREYCSEIDKWEETPFIPPEWSDAYGKHPNSV